MFYRVVFAPASQRPAPICNAFKVWAGKSICVQSTIPQAKTGNPSFCLKLFTEGNWVKSLGFDNVIDNWPNDSTNC